MNNRHIAWATLATLTAAALGFAGARALATGAPQLSPLTYGGVLTDKDGKPYPSAQDVVLKFYDKVDATAPKCTAPATQAEAGTGRFSVVLPGECAQAVRDTPDLWSEATVGGGKTVLPRVHVGAVPYALEADSAKVAGSAVAASGALKTAIDGITADVAGLKKGSGGGPKVVDGAGVVLGGVSGFSNNLFYLVTTKGYGLIVGPSGSQPNAIVPHYGTADCTGTPYRNLGDAPTPQLSTGMVLYPDFTPGVDSYYVETAQGNVPATSASLALNSVFANGKCHAMSGAKYTVFALTKLTPAEAGLPAKITGPLKIVP
jgi:hypothetical protein